MVKIQDSPFQYKIGLYISVQTFSQIFQALTECMISINRFLFHIFLYPLTEIHY